MNKICVVVTTDFWNDRRVFKQVDALLERGNSVQVICSARPEDKIYSDSEKDVFDNQNFRIVAIPLSSNRKFRFGFLSTVFNFLWLISGFLKFANKVAYSDADIFHFHDIDAYAVGFIFAKFKRKKAVFDCHDIFSMIQVEGSIQHKFRFIWYWLEVFLPRYADRVVTVSERLKEDLVNRCKVVPSDIQFVYNVPNIHPLERHDVFREAHDIGCDDIILLYLGSVNLDRGLSGLIDSMRLVNSNVKLVIYGVGHMRAWSNVRGLIDDFQLQDRVFVGHSVSSGDVSKYLMSADIIAIPNVLLSPAYDALPNKFFESMMAGKPIVCNFLPEMSRMVRKLGCGLICNDCDDISLSDGINTLAGDFSLRLELGRRGRIAAETIYNWDLEKRKLEDLYVDLYRG